MEPQQEPGLLLSKSKHAEDQYEVQEFYVMEESKELQQQFSFGDKRKKEQILVAPPLKGNRKSSNCEKGNEPDELLFIQEIENHVQPDSNAKSSDRGNWVSRSADSVNNEYQVGARDQSRRLNNSEGHVELRLVQHNQEQEQFMYAQYEQQLRNRSVDSSQQFRSIHSSDDMFASQHDASDSSGSLDSL